MHGSPIYTLWWEYLVRAYQSPDIEVDEKRYKEWGKPKLYMDVDIWSTASRTEASRVWWKEHGRYLFAEADDRGVKVINAGQRITVAKDTFCLQIPVGTPANEMKDVIQRLVKENVQTSKTSHTSTAEEQLTANEIRPEAYRRWLRMYDMRNVPGCPSFDRYSAEAKYGEVFSIKFINDIHGTDEFPLTRRGNKSDIYRQLWKVKKIVENVAKGEFPGGN